MEKRKNTLLADSQESNAFSCCIGCFPEDYR